MTKITVAKWDGIGPEIMDATIEIILAGGAQLEIDFIEVGGQGRMLPIHPDCCMASTAHPGFPWDRANKMAFTHTVQ